MKRLKACMTPAVKLMWFAGGALTGMMAWLDGPSEGLARIGREQGYLPPYFQKVNGYGIEIHILAAQAVVITGWIQLVVATPNVEELRCPEEITLWIVPLQPGRVPGDVRLLGVGSIGSGSGRRSPEGHQL